MSEWKKVKLGDVCEITSSKRIFMSDYVDQGIPFYRSKEIAELQNGDSISTPFFISEEKYEEIKAKIGIPQKGDLLLTAIGATLGIPFVIKDNSPFYFKDGNLIWFKCFNENYDSSFLYYWMLTDFGYQSMLNVAIGSAQKALTISALKGLEITFPSVVTQHSIATILSRYDSLIENYQKQIKLLEEAAQRLYKEWFVDLHFPGHENTKIVNGVPEGWEKRKVGNVCEINKTNIAKEYKYSYIKYTDLGNVHEGTIQEPVRYDYGQEPGRAKRIAKDGDTIWGMVRPNLKSFALVQNPQPYDVFSTGFAVLSPQTVPFTFLYCALTTDAFVGYLVNCTNGAAYPAVKAEHFENAEIIIPSDNLLEFFHSFSKPIFRKSGALYSQIRLLTEARDRLLPNLMGGEIKV